MRSFPPFLPALLVQDAVRAALLEDFGRAGDITTAATIAPHLQASAVIGLREPGVIAGLDLAAAAFHLVDPGLTFAPLVRDGDRLLPGATLARISGNARALLSAERVALNFLMHLSGVATLTARYAAAIAHTRARVCCTRKTLPGLRALEKYAVRLAGGSNHRFGLDDAILIKDNHIAVSGGVAPAIRAARAFAGHLVRVEVEVDTIGQMREALTATPDAILLDNMPPAVASAMTHITEVFTTAASGASHVWQRNVDWKLVARLAPAGMIGGVIGAYVLSNIDGKVIEPFISGYLILIGLYILVKAFRPLSQREVKDWAVPLVGLAGGGLDAAGGGGWGPIVTTSLIGRGHDPKKVIGSTSLTEFAVTLVISATFIVALGWSQLDAAIGLILGGVLAAPIGAYIVKHLPVRPLMVAVSLIIIATSVVRLV